MGNFDVKEMFEKWSALADNLNLDMVYGEDVFARLVGNFERAQVLQELEGKELNRIWKTNAYQIECEELDKWW